MLMYVVKMNSMHFSCTVDAPTYMYEVEIDDVLSPVCAMASIIEVDAESYSCMEKKHNQCRIFRWKCRQDTFLVCDLYSLSFLRNDTKRLDTYREYSNTRECDHCGEQFVSLQMFVPGMLWRKKNPPLPDAQTKPCGK